MKRHIMRSTVHIVMVFAMSALMLVPLPGYTAHAAVDTALDKIELDIYEPELPSEEADEEKEEDQEQELQEHPEAPEAEPLPMEEPPLAANSSYNEGRASEPSSLDNEEVIQVLMQIQDDLVSMREMSETVMTFFQFSVAVAVVIAFSVWAYRTFIL